MPSFRTLQDYLENPVGAPSEEEKPEELAARKKKREQEDRKSGALFDDVTPMLANGGAYPKDNILSGGVDKPAPPVEQPNNFQADPAATKRVADYLAGNFTPAGQQAVGGSGALPPEPSVPPAPIPAHGRQHMPGRPTAGKPVDVAEPDLDSKADDSALKASVEAPRPPQAPPQALQGDAELEAAQREATRNANLSHFGSLMDRASRTMIGLAPDDAPFARSEAAAQQGVKDLLARREAARQAQTDAQAKAANDPNSPQSQLATKLAQAQGLIGPKDSVSLAQWGMIKDAGSMQEAKAKLASEERRAGAEISSHEKEGASNRANALQLERERMANERAMKLEDIKEKQAAGAKGQQLKPEDVLKLAGAAPGAAAVADAMQDFDKVGGFGIVGGDSAKFKKTAESRALATAIGRNPLAREQLSANTKGLEDVYMPSPSDTKQTAAFKLADQMRNIEGGLRSRINTLKAGGTDTSALESELGQLQQHKERFYKVANKYLPPEQRHNAPHPQDDHALAWARANPNDPRSAAIVQANGG